MTRVKSARKTAAAAVKRARTTIARTARKVSAKLRPAKKAAKRVKKPAATAKPRTPAKAKPAPATARPVRRQPDVPMEAVANAYTPTQTSLKTSFRTSGADQQRDQETAGADRWNDEDHFTNKSGDPRIGTHGRTYEPGEPAPRRNKK